MTTIHTFEAAYALADMMREAAGTGKHYCVPATAHMDDDYCVRRVAESRLSILAMNRAMAAMLNDTDEIGPEAKPPQDGWGPWIDWLGGECPVPHDTRVKVRFRHGKTGSWKNFALSWDWNIPQQWTSSISASDIVAYCVKL
jgi:hypothetical protein